MHLLVDEFDWSRLSTAAVMENVTEALTDVALDGMFKHPYSGFTTHSQCPQKHSYSPNMNDIEGSSHFDEEKEIRDARLPSSNQIAPNLRMYAAFP